MNRRRKILVGALVLAPLAVMAACTFPDVTFAPAGADGSLADGGNTTNDGAASADGSRDGGLTDGDVFESQDGALVDASSPDGATIITDASVCQGKCDCDGDEYFKIGCNEAGPNDDASTAGKLGGNDCDDRNSFVHPNQTLSDAPPEPDGGADWNCSGAIEKAYEEDDCKAAGFLNCQGSSFKQPVPCGQKGDYYGCALTGVAGLSGCHATNYIDSRAQLCH